MIESVSSKVVGVAMVIGSVGGVIVVVVIVMVILVEVIVVGVNVVGISVSVVC